MLFLLLLSLLSLLLILSLFLPLPLTTYFCGYHTAPQNSPNSFTSQQLRDPTTDPAEWNCQKILLAHF